MDGYEGWVDSGAPWFFRSPEPLFSFRSWYGSTDGGLSSRAVVVCGNGI